MPRVQRYIDVDVYTEAKKRIRHVYSIFDSVVVSFSGGKDSLAVLHLTWEVAQELGRTHVDVVFYDEELIPQVVLDFVESYRIKPWVRMLYYCYPLRSTKYVLGVGAQYVQWDPTRAHARPMPAHALKSDRIGDQYTLDVDLAARYRGKIAKVNGIRAAESIVRRQACMSKLNENYINASSHPSVSFCKPIFDWTENDVFRYFYEQGIAYCQAYDAQLYAGQAMRVSTPLHAEAAKRFHLLRTVDPVLYEQVIGIFPEMIAHERYYRELDKSAVIEKYGRTMGTVRQWILENIEDPAQRALALKRFRMAEQSHRANPDTHSAARVLKWYMSGGYKRGIISFSK